MSLKIALPSIVKDVVEHIHAAGGRPLLVGGCVRDALLGIKTHDFDIEVFGLQSYDELIAILSPLGQINQVGRSFSVLKLSRGDHHVDVALPRQEIKVGDGHRGFDVLHDGSLSFEAAASRRDFTINAMGYDPMSHEVLDPFSGQSDLKNRVLRHVGLAFIEDPLRVYRAMQFAARFDLTVDPTTVSLCREIDLRSLPKERLWDEFKKLFLLAAKPSVGLNVAKEVGILACFPELEALIDTPQDPEWHPEGDVWVHTLMVLDEMAQLRTSDDDRDMILMFAALCHDFGKPSTTALETMKTGEKRIRSIGHETAGIAPTKTFLDRLTDQKGLVDDVCVLVKEHLTLSHLYRADQTQKVGDPAIRRLLIRVPLENLILLSKADHFGRTTPDAIKRDFPIEAWIRNRLSQMNLSGQKIEPIIMGRHLLDLGVTAGPKLGKLLRRAFDAQLDGEFSDLESGLSWVKSRL